VSEGGRPDLYVFSSMPRRLASQGETDFRAARKSVLKADPGRVGCFCTCAAEVK
jgi:hypothetical protein